MTRRWQCHSIRTYCLEVTPIFPAGKTSEALFKKSLVICRQIENRASVGEQFGFVISSLFA